MLPLPIDSILPRLIDIVRTSPCVVLRAPAGAGKTTRVPPALIDHCFPEGGQVLVLQPRRVAARAVARRMAEERGGRVGDEVGYHIRFDRKVGRATRIIVLTEGMLVRRLQHDPYLDGVVAVVFDEFHERHLDTDLGLAMCRRVQQTVRPDLRLVVMSATLAAEPIAKYLGDCPVLECDVPRFPVELRYQPASTPMPLAAQAARGVEQLCIEQHGAEVAGDVLVFLPGVREIRWAQQELNDFARRDSATILPLYGELPAEEQDRVFAQCAGRKIVLATNVAETSITIPGIAAVVDAGVARVLEFDPRTGLNRLELKPISKAAADQRAGRAGRTGPGVCLRLWPEAAHRHRPDSEIAEIHRVDLSAVVLQLLDWGETDVAQFPWFESPSTAALDQAQKLLLRLGACDARGITAAGRQMAHLPLSPRLARLMIEGAAAGQLPRAALLAALLAERDPFQRTDRSGPARHRSHSDLLDRADALAEFARSGRTDFDLGTLNRGAAEFLCRSAQQLERELQSSPHAPREESRAHGDARGNSAVLTRSVRATLSSHPSNEEAILIAILAAFPDRLARRREPNSRRAVMVGGAGVRLADQSAVTEGELFVCLDVDAGAGEALVRMASFVDRSWLPAERLDVRVDVEFDADQERVQARRRVRWDDLILEETPASLPEGEQTAQVLAREAAAAWSRVFPADRSDVSGFLARVHCLREWLPDLNLPTFDEEQLRELLPELCLGCRSFEELRQAPWLDLLRSKLLPHQGQTLDREAPTHIAVPSGNRLPIHYEPGRPPILAVRIQEVFGWRTTPRIAGGRVPLLLHLLAPNHRPQQITDDLESFWNNGYPIVRGELRRRYPKHAWPEDPWTAQAERRPQRR